MFVYFRVELSSGVPAAKISAPMRVAWKLHTTLCSVTSPTCVWLVETEAWLEPTCSGRSGAACWRSSCSKVTPHNRRFLFFLKFNYRVPCFYKCKGKLSPSLFFLFRFDRWGSDPEKLRAPHRRYGWLHRQRLLRHWHDHRHRLGPASDHWGGGRHHDHCPEVNNFWERF